MDPSLIGDAGFLSHKNGSEMIGKEPIGPPSG